MSPLDTSTAIHIDDIGQFDDWLRRHGASERQALIAIFKKASGRQTVSFDDLLETAMIHGWVDTQTKRIDDERYAIRFVPRRPGSNWSEGNRQVARRLVAEGRLTPAGVASLPDDL